MSLEKIIQFSFSVFDFCYYNNHDASLTLVQKNYMVKNTSSFMDNQKIV